MSDCAAQPDAVALYDGECGFCRWSVGLARSLGADRNTAFAPLLSPEGSRLLERHGLPPKFRGSLVLVERTLAHRGSEAVLRLARRLRWPWRLLAWGVAIPRPLRDAVYDWVAGNRHCLSGYGGSCAVRV